MRLTISSSSLGTGSSTTSWYISRTFRSNQRSSKVFRGRCMVFVPFTAGSLLPPPLPCASLIITDLIACDRRALAPGRRCRLWPDIPARATQPTICSKATNGHHKLAFRHSITDVQIIGCIRPNRGVGRIRPQIATGTEFEMTQLTRSRFPPAPPSVRPCHLQDRRLRPRPARA